MGFLEGIALWFAKLILQMAISRAEKETKTYLQNREKEKNREEANAENIVKYKAAQDRAEKAKAALDLLNGTRSS